MSVSLTELIKKIDTVIEDAQLLEKKFQATLEQIHPNYRESAINLLHYRAFRKHDLRALQKELGYLGLSRLAKSQSHVMASLMTNRAILQAMLDNTPIQMPENRLSFQGGRHLVKSNLGYLLGEHPSGRRTRIMVTMPTEAADNYQMVARMVEAGMDCARINCAHDDQFIWKKMIANIKRAVEEVGKPCKIAMDLAGPKIRTGPIVAGPKIRKYRPKKDARGFINQPLSVWIGPSLKPGLPLVPIDHADLPTLKNAKTLYFRDARDKKRSFQIVKEESDGFLAHCYQTIYLETGTVLFIDKKRSDKSVIVGELPPVEIPLALKRGDILHLDNDKTEGEPARYDEEGALVAQAHISCTAPELFEQVKVGERILFDDGKIEGIIGEVAPDNLAIEIVYAPEGGGVLRSDKGINFPDSELSFHGLTAKDRDDLAFVVHHTDIINFSFVNRPQDVIELIRVLEDLGAKDKVGLILKIETQSSFNLLTEILLEAMHIFPIGVMIARGDLAIESGWNNIGRIQEEILSICQAAHLTDIWATQVLEGLAKKGIPSRAEISDAVMAQRADCVMLNKGPFILDAIRLLDNILKDMDSYREKNAPLSPIMVKAGRKQ